MECSYISSYFAARKNLQLEGENGGGEAERRRGVEEGETAKRRSPLVTYCRDLLCGVVWEWRSHEASHGGGLRTESKEE